MEKKIAFIVLVILLISIWFSCNKDKQLPPRGNVSTTTVYEKVCYDWEDTTKCLNTDEFSSVLLGRWVLINTNEKFIFDADTQGYFKKGRFITADGNEERFLWGVNSTCYNIGDGNLSLNAASLTDTIFKDKYDSGKNFYGLVTYCSNEFFTLSDSSLIFHRLN